MFRRSVQQQTIESTLGSPRDTSETIYACCTGAPPCAVSIIRISGPKSREIITSLTGMNVPTERKMCVRDLKNHDGEILDQAMVVFFRSPRSYTGEDSAELHLHGSSAVLNKMYSYLEGIDTVRIAQPGEFTKRAFYNGKMDLTQADGVHDLIVAETDVQRKQAILELDGRLKSSIREWKAALLKIRVDLEANIEFNQAEGQLRVMFDNLQRVKQELILNYEKSELISDPIRKGISVAIIGRPNTGKSTLFNTLCGQQRSIVSAECNTTRDAVNITVDVGGYPVVLTDTAGLINSPRRRSVEYSAQKKTWQAADNCDMIIYVVNAIAVQRNRSLTDYLQRTRNEMISLKKIRCFNANAENPRDMFTKPFIIVINMVDLWERVRHIPRPSFEREIPMISGRYDEGVDYLKQLMGEKCKAMFEAPTDATPYCFNGRQRESLRTAIGELNKIPELFEEFEHRPEIAINYILRAVAAFDRLSGAGLTEETLDTMFSKFCIGK